MVDGRYFKVAVVKDDENAPAKSSHCGSPDHFSLCCVSTQVSRVDIQHFLHSFPFYMQHLIFLAVI